MNTLDTQFFSSLLNIAYLLSAILFIFGLKGLTHPKTAIRGNLLGALGMAIATITCLFDQNIVSFQGIIIGIGIGTLIGIICAVKIQMTGMPQLVATFNGLGGAASALIALGEFFGKTSTNATLSVPVLIAIIFSAYIGTVTLWGSLLAFGKLQGLVRDHNIPGLPVINLLLTIGVLVLGTMLVITPTTSIMLALIGAATLIGVLFVLPIGGADMPVVIALLNALSGLAASTTGFVLSNNILIIAGSLVGASGLILTFIMCKAMNRSLANVLFAGTQSSQNNIDSDDVYQGKITETSAEEIAMLLDGVQQVLIVPGYGLAVAQAQHNVRDLANCLEKNDINVEYGIHPVAGRMPGHMNVLLAEADIPYEKLIEMDTINTRMEAVDVAIIIGANDVVNPFANTDPNSPIAGMPIIDVSKARTIVVIKRSLSPGFAGIPNPLFAADNTLMFFGDGKKALVELVAAVKDQ